MPRAKQKQPQLMPEEVISPRLKIDREAMKLLLKHNYLQSAEISVDPEEKISGSQMPKQGRPKAVSFDVLDMIIKVAL